MKLTLQELNYSLYKQENLIKELKEVNKIICEQLILEGATVAVELYFYASEDPIDIVSKEDIEFRLTALTDIYNSLVKKINFSECDYLYLEEIYSNDCIDVLEDNSRMVKNKLKII